MEKSIDQWKGQYLGDVNPKEEHWNFREKRFEYFRMSEDCQMKEIERDVLTKRS